MLIGERRLISDIVTCKVDFSTSLSQNKEFFTRTLLTGPVDRVFQPAHPIQKCQTFIQKIQNYKGVTES